LHIDLLAWRHTVLLCTFTHVAIIFNKPLSTTFVFHKATSLFHIILLFNSKKILIINVYPQPLFKHQKTLRPEILDNFLSGVVKEFKFHPEWLSEVLSQWFPEFRTNSWLNADFLHLRVKIYFVLTWCWFANGWLVLRFGISQTAFLRIEKQFRQIISNGYKIDLRLFVIEKFELAIISCDLVYHVIKNQ